MDHALIFCRMATASYPTYEKLSVGRMATASYPTYEKLSVGRMATASNPTYEKLSVGRMVTESNPTYEKLSVGRIRRVSVVIRRCIHQAFKTLCAFSTMFSTVKPK